MTFEKGCGLWLRHPGVQILPHQPVTTGCLPCIQSFICSSSSLVQGIGFSHWRQGFQSPWTYHLSPSVEGLRDRVFGLAFFYGLLWCRYILSWFSNPKRCILRLAMNCIWRLLLRVFSTQWILFLNTSQFAAKRRNAYSLMMKESGRDNHLINQSPVN